LLFSSVLFWCFDFLVVFKSFKNISESKEGKKCLSQKKSTFLLWFSISRRIKHALKTQNTRHYLDLKYTFLIHKYFK
jgi:hypothetical protein